jgi:hypothetical protein
METNPGGVSHTTQQCTQTQQHKPQQPATNITTNNSNPNNNGQRTTKTQHCCVLVCRWPVKTPTKLSTVQRRQNITTTRATSPAASAHISAVGCVIAVRLCDTGCLGVHCTLLCGCDHSSTTTHLPDQLVVVRPLSVTRRHLNSQTNTHPQTIAYWIPFI